MDALEMALLLDYYGGMLTDKQRDCFDMRYNQDLSLGEIAETMGVSRQAVNDNLSRTEALLRRMEENIGCVKRYKLARRAVEEIVEQFKEADLWYREKEVRFIGTAERFQELVRAVKTVEEPKKVVP